MSKTSKRVSESLIGKKIVAVRCMQPDEADGFGWGFRPTPAIVLVLDDGLQLLACCDQECNGPGALFVFDGSENHLIDAEAGIQVKVL